MRWIPEPDKAIQVTASRPLFWNKTVYERTTASGQRQLIINFLNLPDDHHILGQKQIPPPSQNIALRLPADKPMRAAYFLGADDESLRPLALAPEKNADGSTTWRLPPLECWGLVVLMERRSAAVFSWQTYRQRILLYPVLCYNPSRSQTRMLFPARS